MILPLPNLEGADEKTQLLRIRSYLYQLSGQLNWALEQLQPQKNDPAPAALQTTSQKAKAAQADFMQLKSLIIKSADIVEAYCQEVDKRLSGRYVAQSQFGTYQQETQAQLQADSQRLQLLFENQQSLSAILQNDEKGTTLLGSEAWCRVGLLEYDQKGFPVYGMEIGQKNEEDGRQVLRKFAQYRSDGVYLFDQNDTQVACISDYKLRITNAQITGLLQLGGYGITVDNGLVVRWAE